MSEIEAVCFDLDSTLCVSDQRDEEIHGAVFDRVGVEEFFAPEDVYAVDGTDLPVADSDLEHWENVYRRVAENVGGDPDHAPALSEATVEVKDPSAVSFRDGAAEVLEYVRERYPVAIVTNGSEERQLTKLDALGIRDAFDTIVCCGPDEELPAKPAPEAFERALSTLDVPPEAAIYVGNWLDGDIAGAQAVGMQTAWVPVGDPPVDPEPEPTYRLDSMRDLLDVL